MQVFYAQLCLLCNHIILWCKDQFENSQSTEMPVPSGKGSGQMPWQRTMYFKPLENHTFHRGTYLYSPYMAVPPPGRIVRNFFMLTMVTKYLSHLNNRLYMVQRLFNIIMSCSNSSAYQDKKFKLETLTCQIPHSHVTNPWSNALCLLGEFEVSNWSVHEFH